MTTWMIAIRVPLPDVLGNEVSSIGFGPRVFPSGVRIPDSASSSMIQGFSAPSSARSLAAPFTTWDSDSHNDEDT